MYIHHFLLIFINFLFFLSYFIFLIQKNYIILYMLLKKELIFLNKNYVLEIFGTNLFTDDVMKEYLPKPIFAKLKKTIDEGAELDTEVADAVAHAMKEWAISKGVTHYTHWFQPLTGITAEKHDAFIKPIDTGKIVLEFSRKELIKGEGDASSFPNGGIRSTFEARGYTAWDCTSPAFIKETPSQKTLCIPTIFCAYTGEALDKKTPLLRSTEAINIQAKRILRVFGENNVKKVYCSVGAEQEYFLIEREKFNKRNDLILTGRTLFGSKPPKGQEMDDHYYGSIKENVLSFMHDLDIELWKLGVNIKTEHNEVAPSQHECAPVYTNVNIATDHNQLTMEVMKRVAREHNFECLLHEKPFSGVNGSGKHNNWSLTTDQGKNLLDPGKTPHENEQFLLFLSAVIAAVDNNALLLRLVSSNPGNDHRLGANEAPPAIVSIFLGDQLQDIVEQIIKKGEASTSKSSEKMDIGLNNFPVIVKDTTDRNRTSPFAFTGNKFEFRMVASSISIADTNTAINVSVAEELRKMADKLEKSTNVEKAIKRIIRKTLTEHKRIIFNGNGYSEEWIKEAEKRGLPNAKSFIDAIPALTDDKTIKMYKTHNVLTNKELLSRAEVDYELYSKTINIEALTMIDMVKKEYIPAIIKYLGIITNTHNSLYNSNFKINSGTTSNLIKEISNFLDEVTLKTNELEDLEIIAKSKSGKEQAIFYKDFIIIKMNELRNIIDKLETIVAKEYWPVPSMTDILFHN